jgi:hypothetical protein
MRLTRTCNCLIAAVTMLILLVAAGPRVPRLDPFELILGAPIESATTSGFAFYARGRQRVARNVEAIARLFESQNLVLEADEDGRLAAIHVQIVPDSGSTGGEVFRLADQVRSRLIDRFGAPSWEQHQGSVPAGEILLALGNGEVVRMAQWEMEGRAIRAGIPRRMDGRVFVEIVITPEPLSRNDLFWSSE